ncbi:MAG: hypothetical protein QF902_05130 [Rhodospirillales bacterium]|nr:hypothetical protein [Rhodospirillales bacterium]
MTDRQSETSGPEITGTSGPTKAHAERRRRPVAATRPNAIEAERELFDATDIRSVRILGINALGIIHRHAADLLAVVAGGGTVQILMLNPESGEFRKHRDAQENRGGKVSDRLLSELEASMAILRDIFNHLIHAYGFDVDSLAERFQIRLSDDRADTAYVVVETSVRRSLLYRSARLSPVQRWRSPPATLITVEREAASRDFAERADKVAGIWDEAKPVPLESLQSNIRIVSPRKRDIPHVYAQAVELHKKRRLDEAAALYRTVLRLEPPRPASASELRLAKRHLPRVCTTLREPFALKDLIVVIPPDREQRLLAYHLIWGDDIDYLDDNDPADHEIVWVKYSPDGRAEGAWSFWHSSVLSTSKAVADANAHRVKISVQWGKHGSLLEGWEERIGIDESIPAFPHFEPLEFSRLKNERRRAVGHYAERWPKRFEGDRSDFLAFPVEVDLEGKLDEHRMVVVGRHANAVITQWYLPYNIRPKFDWPNGSDAAAPPL